MKHVLTKALFLIACLFAVGCSTTGNFRIPEGHTLMVTDREVHPDTAGNWETSPFFWSETGGVHYRLLDKNGTVVRTGTLKSHFRVVSIFWPPAALIYWPMGFHEHGFDLTKPGDGYFVVDNQAPVMAKPAEPDAADVKKTKLKAKPK